MARETDPERRGSIVENGISFLKRVPLRQGLVSQFWCKKSVMRGRRI